MTTEMKQLLAILLLGCVFLVHGGEERVEEGDPCTQGMAAMRLFMDQAQCTDPNPFQRSRSNLQAISNNITVHNIKNLLAIFCSTVFPSVKQCFQRNIQNCSIAQRNSLMTVVQQKTGFVCEPNTNRTNHVMMHLLTKLTDADLAKNKTCDRQNLSMVRRLCLERAVRAVSPNPNNIRDVLRNLSMVDLVPKVQTFIRTRFECTVSEIRDRLRGCPQWRGMAIRSVRRILLPPWLGKSMPFTEAEIDQLFQWQSDAQSQVSEEQDDLRSLFK